MRYPRGSALGVPLEEPRVLPLGKGQLLRDGSEVGFIAIGSTVAAALEAAESLAAQDVSCAVFDARFVKPLDEEAILGLAGRLKALITVEENVVAGGFGSAVMELLQERGALPQRFRRIGLPDTFIEHGAQALLRHKYGLDAISLAKAAVELLGR
jgi:1-deoxy-D-xylulose-5-phosphate synthase